MATKKSATTPTPGASANGNGATRGNGSKRGGTSSANFTVPGLSADAGSTAARALQERLIALIDLSLTLKHIHWNVVGPDFIGVHEMLDPQVAGVQEMVDNTAERIAALGGFPNGLAGNLVRERTWDDYDLGRALVAEHLGALDLVYSGVIGGHRSAIDTLEDADIVSQDMLIGQTATLEQYQWFVRAHLESASGRLSTEGQSTEVGAARAAQSGASRVNTARADR